MNIKELLDLNDEEYAAFKRIANRRIGVLPNGYPWDEDTRQAMADHIHIANLAVSATAEVKVAMEQISDWLEGVKDENA